MILYHRTNRKAAESILCDGFMDGEGTYLTDRVWRGVWLSDRPLDENEGACGDVLLRIHVSVPAREIGNKYEWVEEGKGYREFLIPAEVLNAQVKKLSVEEGVVRFIGKLPPPFEHGRITRAFTPDTQIRRVPLISDQPRPRKKRKRRKRV
jgi:hypothetical protein